MLGNYVMVAVHDNQQWCDCHRTVTRHDPFRGACAMAVLWCGHSAGGRARRGFCSFPPVVLFLRPCDVGLLASPSLCETKRVYLRSVNVDGHFCLPMHLLPASKLLRAS